MTYQFDREYADGGCAEFEAEPPTIPPWMQPSNRIYDCHSIKLAFFQELGRIPEHTCLSIKRQRQYQQTGCSELKHNIDDIVLENMAETQDARSKLWNEPEMVCMNLESDLPEDLEMMHASHARSQPQKTPEEAHPAEEHDCPWYASPSEFATLLFVLVIAGASGTPTGSFAVELFDGFLDGRGFQLLNAMRDVGSILGLGYLYYDIILPACRYLQLKLGTCFAAGKTWIGSLRVWGMNENEIEKEHVNGD